VTARIRDLNVLSSIFSFAPEVGFFWLRATPDLSVLRTVGLGIPVAVEISGTLACCIASISTTCLRCGVVRCLFGI